MSKFIAGHVTKMWFLKLWFTSFGTKIFRLTSRKMLKCWCGNVYSTSERNYQTSTRSKQKVVLAAMLEGILLAKNALQHGSQIYIYTNDSTLLKNQSALKYLPQMHFLSNFGCKIIFMCSVNFWHQQDSNSLFKRSNGHVTS